MKLHYLGAPHHCSIYRTCCCRVWSRNTTVQQDSTALHRSMCDNLCCRVWCHNTTFQHESATLHRSMCAYSSRISRSLEQRHTTQQIMNTGCCVYSTQRTSFIMHVEGFECPHVTHRANSTLQKPYNGWCLQDTQQSDIETERKRELTIIKRIVYCYNCRCDTPLKQLFLLLSRHHLCTTIYVFLL